MLAHVDSLLGTWDERLQRMDDNLIALEADSTYQVLQRKKDTLTGVTRERALPALDAVSELFQWRDELAAIVTRARALRERLSGFALFRSQSSIDDLLRLLTGPSIELGRQETPLARRSLLESSETDVTITPDALLERMVQTFEGARDLMSAVTAAWSSLEAKLSRLDEETKKLRQAVIALGLRVPELDAIETEVASIAARVATDPLGADHSFARAIEPKLEALRARLEGEIGARERAAELLARAHSARQRLALVHAEATDAAAEAAREIEGAGANLPRPLGDEHLTGLDDWLAKIEKTMRAGRHGAAEVGLLRWMNEITDKHRADEGVRDTARRVLARREELLGRLSARRAQAAALRARGRVPDAEAQAAEREAEALLRQRPTPLARAHALVDLYEAAIVALVRR